MKKQILKYMEDNPNYSFYTMSYMFGLNLDNLLTLIEVKYQIWGLTLIVDDYFSNIKTEEYKDGGWVRYIYDNNRNLIYFYSHIGNWRKWEYDEMGRQIKYWSSNGEWSLTEYGNFGEIVKHTTSEDKNVFTEIDFLNNGR